MTLAIAKDSVDLGIVTRNPDAMLPFYRDFLGLDYQAETPMPGGGSMHRLLCGTSLIKLVTPGNLTDVEAPPGGLAGASGYRYWTITVSNLDDMADKATDGGVPVKIPPTEIRPGVRIAMIEDPDGNWVELIENA